MYFGFLRCPDACPSGLHKLALALPRRRRLHPQSFDRDVDSRPFRPAATDRGTRCAGGRLCSRPQDAYAWAPL